MRYLSILTVAAVLVASAAACALARVTQVPISQGPVKITGCEYEDSCSIDYRVSRGGEPIWVVKYDRIH